MTENVKKIADRVCLILDEIDTLNEDLKAVYAEAKEHEIDIKALKAAIKSKRKEIALDYRKNVNDYLDDLEEPPLFAI